MTVKYPRSLSVRTSNALYNYEWRYRDKGMRAPYITKRGWVNIEKLESSLNDPNGLPSARNFGRKSQSELRQWIESERFPSGRANATVDAVCDAFKTP